MSTKKALRFLLFGGRFDPPHRGHFAVALHTVTHFPDIEGFFFIPAGIPPHESSPTFTHCERYALLLLTALRDDRFYVWDYELKKSTPSYSIDTIRAFQKTFSCSSQDIAFIVGADAFLKLHTWHDFDHIKNITSWYVVHRTPHTEKEIVEYAHRFFRGFPFAFVNGEEPFPQTPAILYDPCFQSPESATHIREHLDQLDTIREFMGREEYRALQKILAVSRKHQQSG